jgi:hypothetical protein
MIQEDDRAYHIRRAQAELDLAYEAVEPAVIAAHMKLAALHMDYLRNPAHEQVPSRSSFMLRAAA